MDLVQVVFWLAVAMALAQDLFWITVVVAAGLIVWRRVQRRPISPPTQAVINGLVVIMALLLLIDLVEPLAGPQSILSRDP